MISAKCMWRVAILAWLVTGMAFSQVPQYQFSKLNIAHGLSSNTVTCLLKDSRGFMWFGTTSGLNRFDGYGHTVFKTDARDSLSLINNNISRLCEDPAGNIWITTQAGVTVYDPAKEIFISNSGAVAHRFGLSDSVVLDIMKDKKGKYWFVHATEGIFIHDPASEKTDHIIHVEKNAASLFSNSVVALAEDPAGAMWVMHSNGVLEKLDGDSYQVVYRNTFLQGENLDYRMMADRDGDLWLYIDLSNAGVFYFDVARKKFHHFHKDAKDLALNTDIVHGIVQDDGGLIWIGTDHGGINLVDKKSFTIRYVTHDEDDERSLSQNSINAMYKDNEGIIWLGLYKDGVNYYHESIYQFPIYRSKRADPSGLPFSDINRFAEDDKGNLWLGANGGGLIYFDRRQNSYQQYVHNPRLRNSIGNNVIVSLYLDREKKLWIGTYYGGLSCFDGKSFTTYKHNAADSTSIAHDSVWEIFEDSRGNLWIGTLDGGLDVFDRKTKRFKHFPSEAPNSVHSSYVSEITETSDGLIWVGTAYGIEKYDPNTATFTHYLNDINNRSSLSNNMIHVLFEDSRSRLWIGTQEGLNLFDRDKNTFRVYTKDDGLPHNTIVGIVEDNAGHLWVSTPAGIAHLFLDNRDGLSVVQVKTYNESDGLPAREFTENAAFKTSRGELIFGTAKGFTIFNPANIGINKNLPKTLVTDFYVFNNRVQPDHEVDGRIILPNAITDTRHVVLDHRDNVFAIGFSGLNYFHPEKSKYQYILEGFNSTWTTTESDARRVTYTNLDPGTYTFRVKASNNDGLWSKEDTALMITVLPPFWRTNAAFVLYFIAIVLILFVARSIVVQRARMRFQIQHERVEAQRMHELDMMKIRFFTNVSHEFRTPLTLILTPLEKLLGQAHDPTQKNQFQLIQRNARRLLNLVNQLLDFRKVETDEVYYNPSEGDIIKFIREVTYSFSDLSEKKDIQLAFEAGVSKLETFFDQDKLEKILFNLLSNAFKFTPEHGSVTVTVHLRENDQWLEIRVRDTGIGILPGNLEKIFERFFQQNLPPSLVNQGSGIGLSITREFVKIHGGSISVESEPESGSCFTVLIPVKPIVVQAAPGEVAEAITAKNQERLARNGSKVPLLLLIEDNEDFRFYLKDNLKSQYTILEARHGEEGWQQATAFMPDLIVSDIMMPQLNGIELCKRLKADQRTSHIPVIMLTARTAEEQKLEGYESGAHDYIVKPFNFEILQSRIRNIIRQQEANRKTFQQQIAVQGSSITVTSLDEKLIQKAIEIVEKNIGDPDFSVEVLSREVGMSRIHLYRKLHSLTGKSPIEFIRTIRLQRAAQLLEKSQLTVSEIAYQVGFNNPKYFTRYFKEAYQVLPSAYGGRKGL